MVADSVAETQPIPETASAWPKEFGRYVLLAPLAQGGMGDVCLALAGEISLAQRLCVVKTVRPEYATDKDFITRFMDEGRVLCALIHPNIGQILEVGMESATPFVAMEHVAGIDLDALVYAARQARSALPLDFVFIVTAAVLEGMAFAHRATALDGTPLHLVHRDISPQNVRMSWEGDVKVLDFGTAHATGRSTQTAHGLVFGKPGYMSPEQARGERVDARSDLFAIGVVMWELLADRDFALADAAEHMEALAAGSYAMTPPSRLRRDVPRELDEWFEHITAYNPEERFGDAATARRRLVDIGAARGIRFERESVARTLARYFPNERDAENARIRRLVAAARTMRTSVPPPAPPRSQTAPLAATEANVLRGTPYRIGERLGVGGMGEVFAAEHVSLGRKVALKVLFAERSNDPAVSQRFRLEARAIAALEHPNLVQVYDLGSTEDGRLYYAMERLQGVTLRDRLHEAAATGRPWLRADEVVRIGVQVARGLAAAHAAGVVHRDIKPENIFLTAQGAVKLLDFGVAKTNNAELLDGVDRKETRAGEIFGSPAYMAPEQARNRAVDDRTDVYALGAVLYECLTGAVLFDGASLVETLTQQIVKPPVPPRERAPDADVPAGLEAVVLRCLAKDPAERFARATDLAAALEHSLVDEAAAVAMLSESQRKGAPDAQTRPAFAARAATDSVPDELRGVVPRRDRRVWIAAAALLLLVSFGGAWMATRDDVPASARLAARADAGVDTRVLPVLPAVDAAAPSRAGRDPSGVIEPPPLPPPTPAVAPSAREDAAVSADVAEVPRATPVNHLQSAQLAFRRGDYERAITEATQAIQDFRGSPNGARARVILGRSLLNLPNRRPQAFAALCVAATTAATHRDACRSIHLADGCTPTSTLRATCCDRCADVPSR